MKFHKALETSSIAIHPACLDMQHLIGYTFAMETMTHLWSEDARPSYKVQTNTAALQRAYEQVIASDQYREYWREYVETKPLSELYETAFHKALEIASPEMDLRDRDISKMNAYIKEFVAAMDDATHPMIQRMCARAVWRSVELDANIYDIPGGAYHRPTWDSQIGLGQREWDRYLDTFHKVHSGFATTINQMNGMNIDDAVGVLGLVDYFQNFYAVEYYNSTSVEFPEHRDSCAAARALSHICHYVDIPSQSDYYPATPKAEEFKDTMLGGIRDIIERTHLQFPCITAEGDLFQSFEAFIDGSADEYIAKYAPEWQAPFRHERAMLKGELGDLDPVFVSRGCVQTNPFEEGVMQVAAGVIAEIPPLERRDFVRILQAEALFNPLSTTRALYRAVHEWGDTHNLSTGFLAASLRSGHEAMKYDEQNMAKMAPTLTPAKILDQFIADIAEEHAQHGSSKQAFELFTEEVRKHSDEEFKSLNDMGYIVKEAVVHLEQDPSWCAYVASSGWDNLTEKLDDALHCSADRLAKFGGIEMTRRQYYSIPGIDCTLSSVKLEDRASLTEALLAESGNGLSPSCTLKNILPAWAEEHGYGDTLNDAIAHDIESASHDDMDRADYE